MVIFDRSWITGMSHMALNLTYSVPVLVDGEQAMGYIRYLQVWSLTIHPSFPDPRRTTNPDST